MTSPIACPFCSQESCGSPLAENELAFAIPDAYPVSDGHALIIPRAHVSDFLALAPDVQSAMFELVTILANKFIATPSVTGCNIGVNIGQSAGQTIDHAHIHVIPRRDGDVDDPRGGVRWVLPSKAKYWD